MKFLGLEIKSKGDGREKEWDILFNALTTVIEKENKIMAELAEVKALSAEAIAKIKTLNTALDGIRASVDKIKGELEALKAAGLNPEQKAMVDETHANLILALQEMDAVLAENPQLEPPPTEPPPEGDVV